MIPVWLVQLLYIGACLAGMLAIFHLQRFRHRHAPWWLWWTYTALAGALFWEALDAWKYAPPGWPASRWILIPSLAVVMIWAAIADWRKRRAAAWAAEQAERGQWPAPPAKDS